MRVLLHVNIPGKPFSQKRHRVSGTRMSHAGRFVPRMYDPSSEDKKTFQWQLKAACPALKPELHARIGIRINVWTKSMTEDYDNFLKFYTDAMSPPQSRHRHKKGDPPRDLSGVFCAWANDNQIDKADIELFRGVAQERVEILVYALHDESTPVRTTDKNVASRSDDGGVRGPALFKT